MASKGKAVMVEGKESSGKRKRKNRDVLQFFEDAAAEDFDGSDGGSDWSDFFDDHDFVGDFNEDPKVRSAPEKRDLVPIFPKEEELSGDELEQMLEDRYRSGSGYVRYAEDDYDNKKSVDRSFFMPSVMEPIIWKVKCKVGREKNVVFCLMQKYVDLKVLGTMLQIISTFSVEHIKGFVFVEAEKQSDVTEACYQLADVYCTLVSQVSSNEISQLLNVRKKNNEVKVGTWARVKNGIYRGDLTQVVAVNNERKRATVKLIPRVDMHALMEKCGGGSKLKRSKNVVPAARLVSSRELEELRPLMQYRRDRDTGQVFEFLDGLMLKDGFLFKKVSTDSLAFWNVNPTEDELQKFALPSHDESDNMEWLSQLYGEKKKKCDVKITKGGGKGEGSSGPEEQSGFEVHDLVLFGKRDFGMVIGMEKDEKYKVLKDGSEGPVTLTFGQKELKYVPIDKKFTASDHRMKTVSINDTVKILNGPSKGKQGAVKQIYRGILFLYDENDFDNAYFCSKSKMSEKLKHPDSACHGKDEGGPSTFEDVPSSPKSPLSKPWQMRENSSDDRGDKGALFSVGQSLRIRIGPLKGYLCRVLAVRYSEVTVKLDSQQKVLTVKTEHLSEVRGKSSTTSISDDAGLDSSFKPFALLGADGSANDWLKGVDGSADGDGWKVGPSNERSSWAGGSSWGSSVQQGTAITTLPDSANNDSGKEDAAWLTKVNGRQNSDTDAAWGSKSTADVSDSWGKPKNYDGHQAVSWNISGPSAGQGSADNVVADAWNCGTRVSKETKPVEDASGWNKSGSSGDTGSSGWGKQKACDVHANLVDPSLNTWTPAKPSTDPADDSWGKAAGGFKSVSGNASDSAWNSAPSGSSSWGHNSSEKGKGLTNEGASWGKSLDARGEASAMENADKQIGAPENSWGKAAENRSSKSCGGGWASSQSSDRNAWSKGGTSDSSGWKKGGDGWQGISRDKESGSTGGGNGGWQRAGNFENDQGFDSGHGGGSGGFGRGCDYDGRGRGRSDGYSQGGSSWGNSSGGNATNEPSGNKSWGNAGGWNEKGQDNISKEPFSTKSWDSGTGGSSWGKLQLEEGKNKAVEGGSSQTGGSGSGGSWGKSQSGGGSGSWGKSQLEQGHNKADGDGGSSWGDGNASEGGPSWGNAKASGNNGGGGGGGGGGGWGK